MKQYKAFLYGALVTALAFTLFWAVPAYARTGCFPDTNGHWAETLICWLKDNGITTGYGDGTFRPEGSVTRAEMAVMLQRIAKVPPSGTEIHINSGPNSWVYRQPLDENADPPSIAPMGDYLDIRSKGGSYSFVMTPTFPAGLYGRKWKVTGMEYCVDAEYDAIVENIKVTHHSARLAGADVVQELLNDGSDVEVKDCPIYEFTPVLIDDRSVLIIDLHVHFSGARFPLDGSIRLRGLTLFFESTEFPFWD